jgi:uridine kinase
MPVQNRIVKVQKRNRALVKFDSDRIGRAILRAAESIGGFQRDFLPGVNEKIFSAQGSDENIAGFLADAAIVCLNSDPHHLISNFPPTIESIQDTVLHTLRSYGFQNTADAYECYRWGRHWLREGALTPEKFSGNGFPRERMQQILEENRRLGVDTVAGLNDAIRSGRIQEVIAASLDVYERSLDEAAQKVLSRLGTGDRLRMMWVSGPSSSGKTTTTVKLTQRLENRACGF